MTTDNKKLLAKLIAITLTTGAVGYEIIEAKQNETIKEPLKQVVEEFQDDTLLDEADEENIATYENNSIIEEADKVLECISSYDSLNDEDKKWLDNNIQEITTNTLLWSIKSAVANELDVSIEEIQNIGLPYTNEYKELVLSMTYDDKEYQISKKENYLLNALYLYYQVKSNNPKDDPEYKVCKAALNSAKILTMTGIKEENNILESKRNIKEAKRMLKKR